MIDFSIFKEYQLVTVLFLITTLSAQAQHSFKHVDILPLQSSCFNIASTTTVNKAADRGSPCFTLDSTLKSSIHSLFILTLALVLIGVNSIGLINFAAVLYGPFMLLIYSYIQNQKPVISLQTCYADLYYVHSTFQDLSI